MARLTREQWRLLDKLEFRNLEQIRKRMKRRFWFGPCAIEETHVWSTHKERGFDAEGRPYFKGLVFATWIYFKNRKAMEKCRRRGGIEKIKAAFREELERAGRGKRDEVVVEFFFDHLENVKKHGNGYIHRYKQEIEVLAGHDWSWLENDRTWFRPDDETVERILAKVRAGEPRPGIPDNYWPRTCETIEKEIIEEVMKSDPNGK